MKKSLTTSMRPEIRSTEPIGTNTNPHNIRCGYPLCKYFSETVEVMYCPMPIQGSACQGDGNPYEHYYGINKGID